MEISQIQAGFFENRYKKKAPWNEFLGTSFGRFIWDDVSIFSGPTSSAVALHHGGDLRSEVLLLLLPRRTGALRGP